MKDLFESYELLPVEMQEMLLEFGDETSYEKLDELRAKFNALGYDFQYGVDGVAYNLHKIETNDKH